MLHRRVSWPAAVGLLSAFACAGPPKLKPDAGGGDAAGDNGGGDNGGADVGDDSVLTGPAPGVPGGGTGGGVLAGALTVYVHQAGSVLPLPGAFVQVGEVAAAAKTGTTDASGMVKFSGVGSKVTVVTGKTDYVTAVVVDLDAAELTVPLAQKTGARIDTAIARGTVDFTALPAPATGHVYAAVVSYALDGDLLGPRNNVPQGKLGDIPDNLFMPAIGKSEWKLVTPTGTIHLFAVVAEIDTMGMMLMPRMWTWTLAGVGWLDDQVLKKGEDVPGKVVPVKTRLDDSLTVTPGTAPAGLTASDPLVFLDRGPGKLIPLAVTSVTTGVTVPVPKLIGDLATASLSAVATADEGTMPTAAKRASFSFLRGITSTASAAMPPAFLNPPSGLTVTTTGIGPFTAVAGAAAYAIDVGPPGGVTIWTFLLLDAARTTLTFPELAPGAAVEALPAGMIEGTGAAVVIPGYDRRNMKLREIGTVATQFARGLYTGTR